MPGSHPHQQFISTETISIKGAENERKFANGLYQIYLRELNVEDLKEQDSVSTVQKTSWTIHSSFLVRSSMEKGFTLDVITRGAVNSYFPVYWAIFGTATNKQPVDPSEKVVFCNTINDGIAMLKTG